MSWPFKPGGQTALASHGVTPVFKAEVWNGPTYLATIPIMGGQVIEDETAQVRRQCSVTINPDLVPLVTLVPGTVGDLLHPGSGNELHLFRGVTYTDTTVTAVQSLPGTPGSGTTIVSHGTGTTVPVTGGGEGWDAGTTFDDGPTFDQATTGSTVTVTELITAVTATEFAPLGVFRMAPAITDDDTTLEITITGQDRSAMVSQRKWIGPFTGCAGLTVDNAIIAVLNDRLGPGLTYNFTPTTVVVPPTTILGVTFDSNGITSEPGSNSGNDPWADCVAMATSAGCEVFFDRLGTPTLRVVPDPTTVPVTAQFVEGVGCRMSQLGRTFDPTTMCNAVQIIGTGAVVTNSDGSTSPGAAVVGFAYNLNPQSAGYVGNPIGSGTFGVVTRQVVDPTISTAAQAIAAANAMLPLVEAALDATSMILHTPNPTLDAGDAVFVKRDRMGVLGNIYMASVITTPLDDTSPQQVTNRPAAVSVTDA